MTTGRIDILTDWQLVASEPCMIQFRGVECYMSIGAIPSDASGSFHMPLGTVHISGGYENIYIKSSNNESPTSYIVIAK